MQQQQKAEGGSKSGIVRAIAVLFGGLMALFSLLSVLNTAFGWEATVKGTPLPKHWDATLGLIGATVIFWAIWAFLTYVPPVRRFGRNHPWILAMIVVAGLVGAIVGITIWDNANIAARNAKWTEEARQDSLRVQDSLAKVSVEMGGDSLR